jgi:hypothetical protein
MMRNSLLLSTILLYALTPLQSLGAARTLGDCFEVVAVTPSRVINHEVDLQGPFDDGVVETFLTGPQLFAHAIGFGHAAAQDRAAFVNWYKITKPTTAPRRVLSVRDALRRSDTQQITIKDVAFVLLPAQRVTTGPPSRVPDRLNHFKAYKILDATQIRHKVELKRSFGPEERTVTNALFFCVPVEQRHHDEHFPIKDARNCILVYELLPVKHNVRITTIDQFGLNRLEAECSKWLCVPAEIVGDAPAKTP